MLRRISSLMKHEVHQLPTTASAHQAACLMREKNCASVVIVAEGQLAGIFTSGDLVKRVAAAALDPAATRLSDVMTPRPDTVKSETLAIEALQMMQDGRYRHLPVVEEGKIVGIVSRRDFFGQEQAIIEEKERFSEILR